VIPDVLYTLDLLGWHPNAVKAGRVGFIRKALVEPCVLVDFWEKGLPTDEGNQFA
jgi:hypothetical protein